MRARPCHHEGMSRISRRVRAIEESATLAVDGKAKALQAAGVDVIGFGAGEPDFPTPEAIVEAAVAACRDPRNHRYTPTPGLPELRAAIAAKTAATPVTRCSRAGARHQRRQARGLQRVPDAARPRRRGAAPCALLDDVPRGHRARRRRAGRRARDRRRRIPGHRRAAGSGVHAAHEGAGVRVAVEPERRGVPARPGRGDRRVGRRARRVGRHRRDLRAPHLRRARVLVAARARARGSRHLRRVERRGEDLRDDGLARRLDDRARRRHHGRDQPAVAPDVERRRRFAARRARRGERRPRRSRGDARRVRRRGRDHARDAGGDPRSRVHRAAGRVLLLPVVRGRAGRELAGGRRTTTLELCALLLDEAEVAIVPGEAFGAPGYARISFALGDDAIVEGIERIAKFLGPTDFRSATAPASLDEPRVLVAEKIAESGLEAMRVGRPRGRRATRPLARRPPRRGARARPRS